MSARSTHEGKALPCRGQPLALSSRSPTSQAPLRAVAPASPARVVRHGDCCPRRMDTSQRSRARHTPQPSLAPRGPRPAALGALGLVVVGLAALMASTGCESKPPKGNCEVRLYPFEFSSYTDDYDYCATRDECAAYCDALEGRPDLASCTFEDNKYACDTPLPDQLPEKPVVCAVWQRITCGGGDGSFEPSCDPSCTTQPNTSDYDPSLDCLTEIGDGLGQGATCDEAISDLTG